MGRRAKKDFAEQIKALADKGVKQVEVNSIEDFVARLREAQWYRARITVAPDMILEEKGEGEFIGRPGFVVTVNADIVPKDTLVEMKRSFLNRQEAETEALSLRKKLEEAGISITSA